MYNQKQALNGIPVGLMTTEYWKQCHSDTVRYIQSNKKQQNRFGICIGVNACNICDVLRIQSYIVYDM